MTATQVKVRPQCASKAKTAEPKRLAGPSAKPNAKPKAKRKPKPRAPSATAQDVQFIDVSDLRVSKLNMRYGQADPDIEDIYPSILASGVNQSLLVRKEGKGYGVIAGRRRLFALKRKAAETDKPVTAPCIVMTAGDTVAAREASLLENVARLPATELEQFAAFKALAEAGQTSAEIATTFGLTELRVKRVLALANVHPDILKLYEDDELGRESLRHMTMATEAQQAAWLKLWHGPEYVPQNSYLKEWLTGGTPISTKSALFNPDDYDGHIVTDLFGEQGYFQDADLFWEHQNRAIAAKVEALKADGWTSVMLLDRGDYFERYEHGRRDKAAGGKVYIEVGHDGSVTIHEGWLPKKDIKRIDAILGTGEASDGAAKAATAKPEMSGPVAEYVRLHRHAATTATLLDHPGVALRLAVTHMLVGSYRWSVEPQKTTSRKESTTESVAQSQGAVRIAEERQAVFDLLGLKAEDPYYGEPKQLAANPFAEVFASLLAQDDATVMRVMTLAMSMTLCADEDIVETLAATVQPDMAALWSPDDAFFDILRDKRVINAMLKDVGGKRFADGLISETGTKQKAALRNRLDPDVVGKDTAQPDWRPRWMQTAPTHYLDRATCPPAMAAVDVAKAFATHKTSETARRETASKGKSKAA
ncbi:MAG: ParB/RepB/Spo0J family partition protein [Litorimonas sp.]